MNNPEYFLANIINPKIEDGSVVEKWPLHITVIPPFELNNIDEETIIDYVSECGRKLGVIKLGYGAIRSGVIPIEVGNTDMFGINNDIPVIKILDPSNKLHELHSTLLNNLGKIGCNFINLDPMWSGDNYSPHATYKNNPALDRPFFCSTLTLNKKQNGQKIIVKTIDLCEKS